MKESKIKGLTLLEMTIALALFSIIMLTLNSVQVVSNRNIKTATINSTTQDNLRKALNSLANKLIGCNYDNIQVQAKVSPAQFSSELYYCIQKGSTWGAENKLGTFNSNWKYRIKLQGTELIEEICNGTTPIAGTKNVLAKSLKPSPAGSDTESGFEITEIATTHIKVRCRVAMSRGNGQIFYKALETQIAFRAE